MRVIEERADGVIVCVDREGFVHFFSNREEMRDYLRDIRE